MPICLLESLLYWLRVMLVVNSPNIWGYLANHGQFIFLVTVLLCYNIDNTV